MLFFAIELSKHCRWLPCMTTFSSVELMSLFEWRVSRGSSVLFELADRRPSSSARTKALALILFFIFQILCCFILVFKDLVTNEAWVGAASQEVENECTKCEQGRGNKHCGSLCRSFSQIVPIECD